MENKRILVVAPHADDEVLGCGGYMMSEIEKGADVCVIYGTIGGTDCRQDLGTRIDEAEKVAAFVGFDFEVMMYGKDNLMDTVPSFEIVNKIDKKIADFRPDEVFVNYPSRHQDHIKVYECARAAMRLKTGYMPKLFALYEYPFIARIDAIRGGSMYCDIESQIDKKVAAFEMYKTQVKPTPSPLNKDGILTLARMRGQESGLMYSEMFYVQSMVVR